MPASQTVTTFDGLEFRVTPLEEPHPVYFTDESPEFEVHITNNDAEYQWTEESAFIWSIDIGSESVYADKVQFGPLDWGEETTEIVGGNVLSYEGHGVFGIATGGASKAGKDDRAQLRASSKRKVKPAYTFSVWDEHHWMASIGRPKMLQKALIITTVILIVFAAIQVGLALLG